jgi:hypothetical protein
MKTIEIWSLVIDSDSGTEIEIFGTEAERDARCLAVCAAAWQDAEYLEPMPADWRAAWETLESDGCDFWLAMDRHTLPVQP